MSKVRSRWNVLVAAIAGSTLVALSTQPASALPSIDPTPLPPTASQESVTGTGTASNALIPIYESVDFDSEETAVYFVKLRGQGAAARAFTAAQNLSGEAAEQVIEEVAEATREEITAKIEDIVARVPAAEEVFQLTNGVTGVALEATGQELASLRDLPQVESITPVSKVYPANGGNVSSTRTDMQWAAGHLGTDQLVAVIDSGIDFTHRTFGGDGNYAQYTDRLARETNDSADFPNNVIVGGHDFIGEGAIGPDPNPLDASPTVICPGVDRPTGGHGTHVAATIAGRGVNADGTTFSGDYASLTPAQVATMKTAPGVAPGAKLLALRIFGCSGGGYAEPALDWLLAPERATEGNFPDVVNMSLGSPWAIHDDTGNEQIRQLTERGALVVVSAGNDGNYADISGFPASSPHALTVGATRYGWWDGPKLDNIDTWDASRPTQSLVSAEFTARGKHGSHGIVKPDIAAPGTINSALVGSTDGTFTTSGTSMSAPSVSGLAAILGAANPTWSPARLKTVLMNTSSEVSVHDTHKASPLLIGAGAANVHEAVNAKVMAFASDNQAMASVTFGVVDVPTAGWNATKEVTLLNLSGEEQRLNLSYVAGEDMPGVEITVDPAQVTLPASPDAGNPSTATVRLTATVTDPAALKWEGDVTQSLDDDRVPSEAGWLVNTGSQKLRLPVQVAPRPAGSQTVPAQFTMPTPVGSADAPVTVPLTLEGAAIASNGTDKDFENLVVTTRVMAMHNQDNSLTNDSQRSINVRRIGLATNLDDVLAAQKPKDASVLLAIETWKDWARLGTPYGSFVVLIRHKNSANPKEYTATIKAGDRNHPVTEIRNKTDNVDTAKTELLGAPKGSDLPIFDNNIVAMELPLTALGFTTDQISARQVEMELTVIPKSNAGARWVHEVGGFGLPALRPVVFDPNDRRVLAPQGGEAMRGNYAMAAAGLTELPLRVGGMSQHMQTMTFFTRNVKANRVQTTNLTPSGETPLPAPTLIPSPSSPVSQTPAASASATASAPTTITPVAPIFYDPAGNENDKIHISMQPGVIYKMEGKEVSGSLLVSKRNAPIVITAEPAPGYVFAPGSETTWSHTYADDSALIPDPVVLTPPAPEFKDPAGTANDQIVIPSVTGVIYMIDGVEVSGTITSVKRGEPTVITAVVKDGFMLAPGAQTRWTHTYEAEVITPPKPTVTPTPKVTAKPTPEPTVSAKPTMTAKPTPKVTAKPTPKATPTPKPTVTAPAFVFERLQGPSRYATAGEIAAAGTWSDTVLLASGVTPFDALAATPLAAILNSPVLLTQTGLLDHATRTALLKAKAGGAKHVIVVGGIGTVSAAVEREVRALGLEVDRLSGNNRFGTAQKLAQRTQEVYRDQGKSVERVVLVDGMNYADSLAGGPIAAAGNGVILLTQGKQLPTGVAGDARSFNAKEIVAIGGAAATASTGLATTTVAGADRAATAVQAAQKFLPSTKAVLIASGASFPDALAGGAYMAHRGGVVLLTSPASLSTPVANFLRAGKFDYVAIAGGTGSVSADAEAAAKKLVTR
ncbi:MAG: cell wall-binding repeat-containing protein [Buchananella hordeovulneris]|nr:cell wall-binding repeat-containing protein [Buchananella hordeovulneris]